MTQAELTELQKEWEARVAAFRASGQTGAAWCAAHDLKPHQLWYWVGKFKNAKAPAVSPSRWLSVEVSGPASPSTVQGRSLVVRVGRATIEVSPGFDPNMFSDVVRVLTALC